MHYAELLLLLQMVVAILIIWAGKLRISYPVFLVIGGLALSFLPGTPHPQLNPKIVFLLFLPPVLHYAALLTDWREFRHYLGAITVLAVLLVLFTTVAVAAVAHYWLGFPWAVGFVLGAIVSPPDAVAATAVTQTMRVPRSLTTIIEGESLVNDATALVIYGVAIAAIVHGEVSLPLATAEFFIKSVGGLAMGFALGWVALQVRQMVRNSPVALMVRLMTPFCVYVFTQQLELSGVLATVMAGLVVCHMNIEYDSPATRMQARSVWDAVVFLINGVAFFLIGLQLPGVALGLAERSSLWEMAAQAAGICATVVVARFIFILPGYALVRAWGNRHRAAPEDEVVGWRGAVIVSWSGMRGIVSLAAALAVPLALDDTHAFPFREEILFLSFSVVVFTLVFQGLTLPLLIRWLEIPSPKEDIQEEAQALRALAEHALVELDAITKHEKLPDYFAAFLRQRYLELEESARRDGGEKVPDHMDYPNRARVLRRLIEVERHELLRLRDNAKVSDEVFRRLLDRLDHREALL